MINKLGIIRIFPRLIIFCSLCSLFVSVFAADFEKGNPFVRNFASTEYHASGVNYAVVRDSTGIFYAANEDGVIVFDGFNWDLIPIKNNQPVYWVEIGVDGIVYVSSASEFGYLKSTPHGFRYASLMDKIDPKYHDFAVVWEIACTTRETVFRSKKYLFIKKDDQIKVLPSTHTFDVAYTVRDTVMVNEWKVGLCQVINGQLKLIKGGEYFADFKQNIFLPYPENKLLVGSRNRGLFLWDSGDVTPFSTEADSVFYNFNIYHGVVTKDGNYAFASSLAGISILDQQGRLLEYLDYRVGLPDNQLLSVANLDESNLWIGTGDGISKVDFLGPLTYFDFKNGLKDMVTDILRLGDKLYVSTLYGLYQLEKKNNNFSRIPNFKLVNKESLQEISSLDQMNNHLIIGAQIGLLKYDQKNFTHATGQSKETRELLVSQDQTMIYASIGEGHFGVYYQTGNNFELKILEDFIEPIKKIIELNGYVALVTGYGNLWLLQTEMIDRKATLKKVAVYKIGNFNAIRYNDQLMVLTPAECFFLTMEGEKEHVQNLPIDVKISRIQSIERTKDDHIWLCFEDVQRMNYCEQIYVKDGVLGSCEIRFRSDFRINTILCEENGISWFGGSGGLLRYDMKSNKSLKDQPFECHISKLIYNEDSTLFQLGSTNRIFEFEKQNLNLQILCFTNQVLNYGETMFQYKLDGADEKWSQWTPDPVKNYTNLNHGTYTLMVRAKNADNKISSIDSLEIIVLSPWYQNKYVILLGICFLIFIFYLVFQLRIRQIQGIKLALEKVVLERTREVELQKEVLKKSNETKDQLFSIIGHDLRSPLNSIQGIVELIQHYRDQKELTKMDDLMGMLTSSVKQLRHLLDNLLTWTLNQSGQFNLIKERIEVKLAFFEMISILKDAADKKDISVVLEVDNDLVFEGDKNTLSTMVRNLLSNAIKFTHKGGEIVLSCEPKEKGILFSIKDNGVGIPQDKLNSIFDLNQTTYGTSNEKGTGIGLNLVKDFVDICQGEIFVESTEGKGTKFAVFLPNMN